MDNAELKNLLTNAAHEIRQLRRSNEIMAAQLEMVALFDRVLNSRPPERHMIGTSEDVAWSIDRALFEIEANERKGKSNG